MQAEKHILYEDNHLLVVNKPSGVLSQGDQTGDYSILEIYKDFIKKRDKKPGNVYLGLAHRIDRPVSGALILCKTSKSLSRMADKIRNREMRKIYHALVKGKTYSDTKRVVDYIKKDTKRNRAIISSKPFKGAREAVLTYKVIAIIEKFSLVEIELETGRPHQIRAQLHHHKMPIYGDSKYSGKKPLPDKSIALHARRLVFDHPVSDKKIDVTAPYPDTEWWGLFNA